MSAVPQYEYDSLPIDREVTGESEDEFQVTSRTTVKQFHPLSKYWKLAKYPVLGWRQI